ncbi:MAG: hypothetical protein EBR58_08890 [Betaproteobacteria bacterium]|nr:hypothetical protein [Betaproteobacteria bacterium]
MGTYPYATALSTWALLLGSSAALAQQGSDDPANHYDRYTNAQLEAVCEATSPTRYISGLTDGGWGTLGIGGKTYYYRSACYMELVRRTGRAELERHSLWGDGSNHSPKACAEVAAAYQAREKHKASVEGAFRISELQVQVLPGGHWQVEVHTEGQRSGTYQLQLVKVRDGTVLRQETLAIHRPESFSWKLSRTEVVAGSRLPDIFPMAVRMSYLVPASASRPAAEHSTDIRNFTLSAE